MAAVRLCAVFFRFRETDSSGITLVVAVVDQPHLRDRLPKILGVAVKEPTLDYHNKDE